MKFVRPGTSSTALELSNETLQLGDAMELVHFDEWNQQTDDKNRGCWAQHLDPAELLKSMDARTNSSILQSAPEDFESDVRAWVKMRQNPSAYFVDPLHSILPSGTDFEKRTVASVSEKESLREFVETYSKAHGNQSCQEAVHALFEELFMNATLDAPRENGALIPGGTVTMFMAVDERRIGIACQDPYGSLKLAKMLSRMRDVYERGAGDSINLRGPGGAGLGCVIMLEKSSLICFGVRPGKVTMVSCLVPRFWNHRKRAEMKKSLHLILTDND